VTLIGKLAAHGAAVLTLALLLSGCALAGRSFGGYVDDKTVTGGVKLSLAAVHLSHLRRVNVDVYDGVVYLTGTVQTALEKSDAEIAAWETTGVEQVVNDVVVRDRERPGDAISALPDLRPRHPLMERFTWVTRMESTGPGGPELAYDASGLLVATIYTVSARGLVDAGDLRDSLAPRPAGAAVLGRALARRRTRRRAPLRRGAPGSLY
jgi:hypothetical protein